MRYLLGIILLFMVQVTEGQTQETDSDILFYADVMNNAFEGDNRIRAGKEFYNLFVMYMSDNSLEQLKESSFSKFIMVTNFPEENRALISWHIKGDDDVYDYKGFYCDQSGKLMEFNRTEALVSDMSYTISTTDDWYGALYYNIMKLEKNKYLVFGLDANGTYDNQRILDVMTIGDDGIILGDEIFEDKDSPGTYVNRLIISYSSDASVSFKYDPTLKVIIHDHLEPRMGLQAGQGVTSIPDGTYEGYYEKGGKWLYKKKIFDHVYDEAPIPKPVQFDKPEKTQIKKKRN